MTTAHVQTKAGGGFSINSLGLTFASSVTAGNHISCYTGSANTADPTPASPTSSPSATWHNALSSITNTGGGLGTGVSDCRVDYTENVAGGTWTVTVSTSSGTLGTNAITATASESSGVATSLSIGNKNHAVSNVSGVTSLATGSITPTSGSIVYAYTWSDNSSASTSPDTINSSFTVESSPSGGAGTCWDPSTNVPAGDAALANVAGTALNPTWTAPATTSCLDMTSMIVEFLAAAANTDTARPVSFPDRIPRLGSQFFVVPSPTWLLGTDLPRAIPLFPERVARLPVRQDWVASSPTWLIGNDLPRAIPLYPDGIARPKRPPDTTWFSPTAMIGTDQPRASGAYPDTAKRLPQMPDFWFNNTVGQPAVAAAPPVAVYFPNLVARPIQPPDYWLTAPVRAIGTDEPAFGRSWPDQIARLPVIQGFAYIITPNIGTDLPRASGSYPDTAKRPNRPPDFAFNDTTFQPASVVPPAILAAFPELAKRLIRMPDFWITAPVRMIGTDQPRAIPWFPERVRRPNVPPAFLFNNTTNQPVAVLPFAILGPFLLMLPPLPQGPMRIFRRTLSLEGTRIGERQEEFPGSHG